MSVEEVVAMRSILILAMVTGVAALGTSLSDGQSNQGATGNGSTSTARQWDLGGGLTMTVSGYSDINGVFSNANTTQFGVSNSGLGVCGVTPGAVEDCTFNQWQVDNATPGGQDFVLFTFNSPVNLVNFTVGQSGLAQWFGPAVGADSNWSWATSSQVASLADLAGLTLHNVDGPFLNPGASDTRTIAGAVSIRSLLIGVGPASEACGVNINNCDYFKLTDLSVSPTTMVTTELVPNPEPGSLGLLGIGLTAVGLVLRRRSRAAC
jgi:hypothetical protein